MGGRGRPKKNHQRNAVVEQRSSETRKAVLELFVSPKGARIEDQAGNLTPRSMQSEISKGETEPSGSRDKLKMIAVTPATSQASGSGSGNGKAQEQARKTSSNGTVPCNSGTVENNKNDEPREVKSNQSWANVVAGNKLAMKGMNLQFVAPVVQNGEKIAKLEVEDVEQENEKWRSAIVLYVIGDSPTIGAMERFLSSVGKFSRKPQIYYHNEGYFVIRFSNLEERDQILYSGPHTVNNKLVIMKAWTEDFNIHDEVLKTIPLWVRFPNLPLNCWSMKALCKIGSTLGNPMCHDPNRWAATGTRYLT
ncbi:PREDICTED: uncharacterized protein LOC109219080 [Nicotiana attenuata]|uniref:uncharacterized protein LOC109219080 n=1 Tax=Nicotiana attenuata TaxID=49451 RepID=UPI00090562CC|nr:PREDICTED: uncharacterized protein LOC109219080 [Nicotiana attenuata]XP_019239042.1 PREDICTED: uncharacterized protein LOC109219080 [Nicotiana attenuata]XP_019239043.1 PREDICTED: uncharacterized protein LOC109219080 [Nicotiana attenuata]XP_019239044.1 PREDICTED: uncharacterized protein LOC109219080 [Nicotiana attenuata]XP_019239045.1 PREDICTED: uncharacterized protein LOC109219080 [Nicotiana attenuata]XP_019239046.1 PREDICTED: uncharacterized protein LOC109219080 [Nicotiana attenuata]